MSSRPEKEPEELDIKDVDMESKTVEEQTTETAEPKGLDENEDEGIPGLEMPMDGPSTSLLMGDPPMTVQSGTVGASLKTERSTGWEVESPEGMDTDIAAMESSSDDTLVIGDDETSPVDDFDQKFTVDRHNNSTAGESDERAATGDHNMNTVRGSHKTSTTESSDTTDFRNLTIESLDKGKVEIKSFNFLGCPDNVLERILHWVLVRNKHIKPYWNFCSLEVAAEDARKENFAPILVALAGNEKLIDKATTILYGENVFKLQHAKVSLWWLKRIGSNLSKIKHLVISVEEGVKDGFGTRFETLWYSIFLLLEAEHKLQSLKVNFEPWTFKIDALDGLDPDKDRDIWEPRYGILRTLAGFRGLNRAIIKPGPYVNKRCTEVLEDALVMSPGQTSKDVTDLVKDLQGPKRTKYVF